MRGVPGASPASTLVAQTCHHPCAGFPAVSRGTCFDRGRRGTSEAAGLAGLACPCREYFSGWWPLAFPDPLASLGGVTRNALFNYPAE